jgi:hypothetical protein
VSLLSFSGVNDCETRILPIAPKHMHRCDLLGRVVGIRRDDGDLPIRPAEVIIRSGHQPEQQARPT